MTIYLVGLREWCCIGRQANLEISLVEFGISFLGFPNVYAMENHLAKTDSDVDDSGNTFATFRIALM